jgi:hypothetical protein
MISGILCQLLTPHSPQAAEQVHHWIARHLPDRPHPPVKRPINYMRWGSAVVMLLGMGTLAVTATPYVWPIIQNRNLWAAVSLIAILLFTSGHMYNHIRKVPYVAGDGKGGISYFAGGFQNQYGLETQIVAALCTLLPLSPYIRISLTSYQMEFFPSAQFLSWLRFPGLPIPSPSKSPFSSGAASSSACTASS